MLHEVRALAIVSIVLFGFSGCSQSKIAPETNGTAVGKDSDSTAGRMAGKMNLPAGEIRFKDEIEGNVQAPDNLAELQFKDKHGKPIRVADYFGKKQVSC